MKLLKVNPIALFLPMNEGSGIAHDSSGNGNNGTLSGGATWDNGDHGRHIEVDGVDGLIECGNAAILRPTKEFAIGIWIKPAAGQEHCYDGSGNFGVAGSCDVAGATSTWSWQLRYGSEAVECSLGLQVNTAGGSKWVKVGYALTVDIWTYIIATFTPTQEKIYVNAVLTDTENYGETTINTVEANQIMFGCAGWGNVGTYYEGGMADARFYVSPPTPTEITNYFNAMKARFGL